MPLRQPIIETHLSQAAQQHANARIVDERKYLREVTPMRVAMGVFVLGYMVPSCGSLLQMCMRLLAWLCEWS